MCSLSRTLFPERPFVRLHHLQSQVLNLFPPLLLSIRSSKAGFRNQPVWILFMLARIIITARFLQLAILEISLPCGELD